MFVGREELHFRDRVSWRAVQRGQRTQKQINNLLM